MDRVKFLLGLLSILSSASAFAGGDVHFLTALGGGAAYTANFGKNQNFYIADPSADEFYYYTANSNNKFKALVDVFLGVEWAFFGPFAAQFGLDLNQIQGMSTQGTVIQGLDLATADQFSYSYSLMSRQVLAEAKLLYQFKERYFPYILVGGGAAFNKAYNYSASVPPFTTFTRQYANNTQIAFSYCAGAGIDMALAQQWRIGLGYRYTDLGQVSLGPATINANPVGGSLHQAHLYVNEALAQLTWVG